MRRVLLLLVLSLFAFTLNPAQAQPVPRLLSYQGVLYSGGSPVTTATSVTFALFEDAGCTSAFPASGPWSQVLSVTPDAAGVFSTVLGSDDPANAAYFSFAFDRALYLKTSIGGTQVACQALAAVPYALGLYGLRVEPAADPTTDGPNVIGGYSGNSVGASVVGATISGGGDPDDGGAQPNQVTGNYGTVGGGLGNTASGLNATVGGGSSNEASGYRATVGGGEVNTASDAYATVGGGQGNTATNAYATVGGGIQNTASGLYATVPGGNLNQAGGWYSYAAGRRATVRDAATAGDSNGDEGTFAWADSENADFVSTGPDQFLVRAGGGVGINTNDPQAALHIGGTAGVDGLRFPDGTLQTTAAGAMSVWQLGGNAGTTVGTDFLGTTDAVPLEVKVGGARVMRYEPETATEGPNVIGGWSGNSVGAGVDGATIAGGGDPDNGFGTPRPNEVTGDYGTVGGGQGNTASADYATVGGGWENTASGSRATVGGGQENTASDFRATVGGGLNNTASGRWATVGGGGGNTASGFYATVPGGSSNQAGGEYSFAAGRRAKVRDAATVGGGDTDGDEGTFVWADVSGADFISTGPNQFRVRASGGTTFFSNAAATIGVTLAHNTNAWAVVSDSTRKERFLPADGERVLTAISAMRLGSWNYRGQDPARFRHYGPMAQDFFAAFGHDGVGVIGTDTTLATGDVDGVLFIAVQALAARTAALDEAQARIDAQQARIDGQQARIDGQQAEIDALRAQVAQVDQVQTEMARQQAEMAALRALVEGALRAETPAETGEVTRAPRD